MKFAIKWILPLLLALGWIYSYQQGREIKKLQQKLEVQQKQYQSELTELEKFHEARRGKLVTANKRELDDLNAQLSQAWEDRRQLKLELERRNALAAVIKSNATTSAMENSGDSAEVSGNISTSTQQGLAQVSTKKSDTQQSYADLIKALRDTPEMKQRAKEQVDRYFEGSWSNFGSSLDPAIREDILNSIKQQTEKVIAMESSMWMVRDSDARGKINEDILAQKLNFRDDFRNKFGQDKLDMFNEHLMLQASQSVVDRMGFLDKQDDKKNALLGVIMEVKKRNEWDDGMLDAKLSTMDRPQFETFKAQASKLATEITEQSASIFNEQEKQQVQQELDHQNRRLVRRYERGFQRKSSL